MSQSHDRRASTFLSTSRSARRLKVRCGANHPCQSQIAWAAAALALAVPAGSASAALSFKSAASSITFTHDVIDGGAADRSTTISGVGIPAGSGATFPLTDMTLSTMLPGGTVSSRAVAGMGQITTSTTGTGTIKSGSLITQSDPSNASADFSSLTFDYHLVWDVTAPGFGAPIVGSFNVPILAVVGAGGAAKVEIIDMRWQKDTGGLITDLRAPANTTVNFLPGSTLTGVSVPSAAFSPSSLTTADDLIVKGKVKISVKNAVDPVRFYYELPTYDTLILDNDQPEVYYRFNDGLPGNPVMVPLDDSSPGIGGNQTTQVQMGAPTFVPGVRDSGVHFGGTDSLVVTNPIMSAQSFSAEVWVASDNPNQFVNTAPLFGITNPNGFFLQALGGTNTVEAVIVDNAGNFHNLGAFPIPVGTLSDYHHLVLSFDQATNVGRFYLDGTEMVAMMLGITRAAGSPLALKFGTNLVGSLDEFAYYSNVVQRSEVIAAVHQLGRADPSAFEPIIGAIAGVSIDVPEPCAATLLLAATGLTALRRSRRQA